MAVGLLDGLGPEANKLILLKENEFSHKIWLSVKNGHFTSEQDQEIKIRSDRKNLHQSSH